MTAMLRQRIQSNRNNASRNNAAGQRTRLRNGNSNMFLNLESTGIEMMGIPPPYSGSLGLNGGITALSDINPILPQ